MPALRCQAKKKDGSACSAPATKGGFCFFHAHPDQARILGQKGGRKNRYQVTDVVVPENITGATLGTVLDQAMGELLAGRMDPRVATALAQLVNTRRRLSETVDLEKRIMELERKWADQGSAAVDPAIAPADQPIPALWIRKEDGNGDENAGGGSGKV